MLSVLRRVLRRLYEQVLLGPSLDQAAQLAFYAVLALAPFLLVVTSLATIIPEATTVFRMLGRARAFLPPAAFELIEAVITDLIGRRSGTFLTFGLAAAVWSASRAANSLRVTLNAQFGLKEGRPWLRQQALAIIITIFGAILLLGSAGALLLSSSAIEWFSDALQIPTGARTAVWLLVRWPVIFVCLMLLAALAFRALPDARASPGPVFAGAAVTTLIFFAASWIFTWYATHVSDFGPTYGALTGGVVLLLWTWLTAIAFVVGGEVVATFPARPRRAPKVTAPQS